MASSDDDRPHLLPAAYATTPAPPPPTPSAQSHGHFSTTSNNYDALSRILLRLPPTLSIPSRRSRHSPSTSDLATTTPPLVPLSSSDQLLSAATQLGLFRLSQHYLPPPHLLHTATLEAESLLLRHSHLPLSWPLGFNEDNNCDPSSFCFDIVAPPDEVFASTTLIELASSLEKLGFEVMESLASGLGLENPFRDQSKASRLMWVSKTIHRDGDAVGCYERFYPYMIGLHCKMSGGECSILAESGRVTVDEAGENVLVTVGDIAQVWSNGKLKTVRWRPVPNSSDNFGSSVAISFFLTLPMDSIVTPLPPASAVIDNAESKKQ